MIYFKLSELATIAGGKLVGEDNTVECVSTNSKNCGDKNTLFIALVGQKFDAHNFLNDALKNGASFLAVAKEIDKNSLVSDVPYIVCEDTQRLLGLCGLLVRQKAKARICSITGSCGKTTVKEMCSAILKHMGKTLATKGNFNNDIGVPLTLLGLDESYDYAVIEQGASHPNDIKRTCEFIKSEAALINNVGSAHIEGFLSYDGVYRGKSEILDDVLPRGGIGIIPADSKYLDRWHEDYAKYFAKGQIKTFGFKEDAGVRIVNLKESVDGTEFDLVTDKFTVPVKLSLLGAHNAQNAAAACALTMALGATKEAIEQGFLDTKAVSGRFNIVNKGDFLLIDDSYNASPNAVLAAIDTLSMFNGYKVLVFGDMGELGTEAVLLHQKIGVYAKKHNIDRMLCLGPLSQNSVQAMGSGAMHFADHDSLYVFLKSIIEKHKNCVVLVKGSHSMHMEKIVNPLKGE